MIERIEGIVAAGTSFVAHAHRVGCGGPVVYSMVTDIDTMLRKVAHIATQCARRAWIQKEKVPASDRIFSIFEDHTELLKRGKSRQPVEFGHLVTLAQTKEKIISFYKVEEHSRHDTQYRDEVIKAHVALFGNPPKRFTADKNYHISPEDTAEQEKTIDLYAVGKKGRRSENEEAREHAPLFREAQAFRAGIEGSISVLKRVFGLKRCFNKGFKSFLTRIGSLVFCHNLVVLATP